MITEHGLLERLAVDQPWSWSREGLDDRCMFCGSRDRSYTGRGHDHVHARNCPWMQAMEFLGRAYPGHRVGAFSCADVIAEGL